MFESWRKTMVEEIEPRVVPPREDPALRDAADPDPLVEEMVQRLRDGLSSMNAFDEWGRPMAWRNVVRLAVGPLASRLRDAETAATIAANLHPEQQPAAEGVVLSEAVEEALHDAVHEAMHEAMHDALAAHEAVAEPELGAVPYGASPVASRPMVDVELEEAVVEPAGAEAYTEPVEAVVEAVVEAMETLTDLAAELPAEEHLGIEPVASRTEVWGAPVEAPVEAVGQVQQPAAQVGPAAVHPVGVTSVFAVSGDQRPVAKGSLGPGELLRRSGTHDATVAKYDRFLTSLYGEPKQAPEDEDRDPGAAR